MPKMSRRSIQRTNRGILKMVCKAKKYLNNTINQDKLFDSIDEDIREIIKPYKFEKVVHIKESDVGEITIQIQDPIPSKLINELNNYFDLEALLEKDNYSINLVYKLEKGL